MEYRRLTRAELATRTGISKPTISESVRRLEAAGLVVDTGERTTGRGRVGSYFGLAPDLGCALVLSVAPEGVVAETIDAHGDVAARATEHVARPAPPAEVERAIRAAIRGAQPDRRDGPASRSSAQPIRWTAPPDGWCTCPTRRSCSASSPPSTLLADVVDGPVLVDNDVNWAARAERAAAVRAAVRRLRLPPPGRGPGLRSGHRRRGPARTHRTRRRDRPRPHLRPGRHAPSRSPRSSPTSAFADRDQPRSTSTPCAPRSAHRRAPPHCGRLARAICGVLTATVALADPELVIVGGTWGLDPALLDALIGELRQHPRPVPVRAPRVTDHPSLTGARDQALHQLRNTITDAPQPRTSQRQA